ncbi:MAG: hypothetical protein EPO08_14475 [Rhodospirillaceae bacterium]|nr:MAG: hypothetical protein EPO08_14475 [Rhodospirillaceae bacterium]
MTPRPPHIVCFAPYADWTLHSARQVTILQGLRQRGCTVSAVLCDGVFSDCDMHQPFTDGPQHRPAKACLLCQAGAAGHFAKWGMPYRWLGRWLDADDFNTSAAWVTGLKPATYPDAVWNGWELGDWVKSSLHSHFRHNVLDLSDPRVAQAYASYLNSARLAAVALSRLYDEEKPDVQLTMNGRMGVLRVALELAKQRGIRTLCEERAYVLERMMLFDNVHCLDNTALNRLWRDWQDIPLTVSEIDDLAAVLHRRWTGSSGEMVISPPMADTGRILSDLGFDPNRPVWALFTSCVDECISDPSWGGVFPSQETWIEATLAYIARHPNLQLVIRVHPNTGSLRAIRSNPQELAYFAALANRLPDNVRLVDSAATVSSYGLAAAAQVGLIWYSTVGLEMATMGRTVVRAGGGWCPGKSFLRHADDPAAYERFLDEVAARPEITPAATVAAWRFAYLFFLRQSLPFPLVDIPHWSAGRMAYAGPAALAAGRDPSLDAICDAIMTGRSLVAAPPERRSDDMAAKEELAIGARIDDFASASHRRD